MNDKITVTVSSSANVGKSTIARFLKFALHSNGIDSTIDDIDGENEIGDIVEILQRLEAIKSKNVEIDIVTVNKRKSNYEK